MISIKYNGYTRTHIYDFPALRRLNDNANDIMTSFKEFLKDLEEDILEKKVLGIMYSLMTLQVNMYSNMLLIIRRKQQLTIEGRMY